MSPYYEFMSSLAVFLRGINVGGVRISMPALQEALSEANYDDVATVLATGNVLLDPGQRTPDEAKKEIEGVLRSVFGYEAWVLVKTPEQVAQIVSGYPFDRSPGTHHAYGVLATSPEALAEVVEAVSVESMQAAGEQIAQAGDILWWECPKGNSLDTPVAKYLAKAKFKPLVTTRNLNTFEKVLAKLT